MTGTPVVAPREGERIGPYRLDAPIGDSEDSQLVERFKLIHVLAPFLSENRIKVYSVDSVAGQAWLDQDMPRWVSGGKAFLWTTERDGASGPAARARPWSGPTSATASPVSSTASAGRRSPAGRARVTAGALANPSSIGPAGA